MRKHTILFLAADPGGTDRSALEREARAIQLELERSGYRDHFEFESRWAVEPLDLLRELRKLKPTVVHVCGHGADAARTLMKLDRRPTAVFASSDAQAFGLLRGLASAGVRVPADVAVVGFDGTDDGAYAAPPLTSARQPVAAMAAAALDALRQPPGSAHELFALDLVVRESCGCRAG